MTIPFVVDAIALANYREWERLTNELSVASAQLAAVAGDNRYDESMSLVLKVDALVNAATRASQAYVAFKIPVATEVMDRWKSVLRRSQTALAAGRAVRPPTQLAPVVITATGDVAPTSDPLDKGFRIPGTQIIVPWIAVAGVVAVVVAGLYFSKRRR